MGGCTNCKGKAGCDHRKGAMIESVDRALETLYPTRTWGEPDDSHASGMSRDELAAPYFLLRFVSLNDVGNQQELWSLEAFDSVESSSS